MVSINYLHIVIFSITTITITTFPKRKWKLCFMQNSILISIMDIKFFSRQSPERAGCCSESLPSHLLRGSEAAAVHKRCGARDPALQQHHFNHTSQRSCEGYHCFGVSHPKGTDILSIPMWPLATSKVLPLNPLPSSSGQEDHFTRFRIRCWRTADHTFYGIC